MVFVDFTNSQDLVNVEPLHVESLVTSILGFKNVVCDEISIHFVSKEEICELHADYFNDPTPTDCITFPIDSEEDSTYRILGEIFVCPEVAISSCKEFKTTLDYELSLYIVHGILHLLGYDDIEEEDEIIMRKEESLSLEHLKKNHLLLPVQETNCSFKE